MSTTTCGTQVLSNPLFSVYIVLNFFLLFLYSGRRNTSSMHRLWQKVHQKRAFGQSHAITYKWHAIPLRNLWQVLHQERTLYQPHFMVNTRVTRHLVSSKLYEFVDWFHFSLHCVHQAHWRDAASLRFLFENVHAERASFESRAPAYKRITASLHLLVSHESRILKYFPLQPHPSFNHYLYLFPSCRQQHEDVHTQGTSSQPYAPTHWRNSFQMWILPKGKFCFSRSKNISNINCEIPIRSANVGHRDHVLIIMQYFFQRHSRARIIWSIMCANIRASRRINARTARKRSLARNILRTIRESIQVGGRATGNIYDTKSKTLTKNSIIFSFVIILFTQISYLINGKLSSGFPKETIATKPSRFWSTRNGMIVRIVWTTFPFCASVP